MGDWPGNIFNGGRSRGESFLTTDHPNGAPFTSYPHLIKFVNG